LEDARRCADATAADADHADRNGAARVDDRVLEIAGLVLVRGLSRRGELALRLALGATRTRVIRCLIVESLVLAVPGAILGVVLASRGIPAFAAWAEGLAAPRRVFFNMEIDRFVMVFAALVASGSALVFGLFPALRSSRVDLVSVINEDASPRGAARGRLRMVLVVAQVAVSLLLLVGSGLGDAQPRRGPARLSRVRREPRVALSVISSRTGTTKRAAACSTAACSTPSRRWGRRIGHARGLHTGRVPRHAVAPRCARRL